VFAKCQKRTSENEGGYFFFDLHMAVGHIPLRTLQGEKSPIILPSGVHLITVPQPFLSGFTSRHSA
jgi:hypothetical protein